ncbi:MAG: hypothetical protein U0R50_07955 [Gaiellales bacterium]
MARAPRSASWGAVAILAVATLWVAVALGQVNSLLGAMHVAGSPSFTISALAGGPDKAEGVLRVWTAHKVETDTTQSAGTSAARVYGREPAKLPPDAQELVGLLSRLDTLLFVPLYTTLALLFLLRAGDALGAQRHRLPEVGIGAILLTACFDVAENVAEIRIVDGWADSLRGDGPATVPRRWAEALQIVAAGKWIAAGVAALVAMLVLAGLVLGRSRRDPGAARETARRTHAVAFQVIIALAAIVLFNQQGQVADLYRRWQAPQAVLSLVALAFAGFALWAVTRRLIVQGTLVRHAGPTEHRLKRVLFAGLWLVAAAQLALHLAFRDAAFDPGWGLVVPALLATILAVLGLGVAPLPGDRSRRGVGPQPATEQREPRLPRLLAAGLVVGFAIALLRASFGYAIYTRQWSWGYPAALLGAAGLGAAAGLGLRRLLPAGSPDVDNLARRVIREPVTWAVIGTLAGVCALAPWGGGSDIQPTLLVSLSILLTVGALRWHVAMGRERLPAPKPNVPLAVVAVVLGLVLPAAVAFFAVQLGQWFSVPGVASLFVAAAALVAGLIAWGAPWLPLPRAIRGLPAFPATLFLIVWFVVAAQLDRTGSFHDARIVTGRPPAAGRTAAEQLGCWLGRHGLTAPEAVTVPADAGCAPFGDASPQGVTPLIVVASTGGGIRAAYWTTTVLDCAFDRQPEASDDLCLPSEPVQGPARSESLFALSGISGGSVGMAEYAAHLTTQGSDEPGDRWVRKALEVDGLSPTGARWLFVEIARSFLQFTGPADRAAVLERSFENRWPNGELGQGLFEVGHTRPGMPLLLLNSTSVADGCRFNVSILDGNIEPASGLRTTCRSNAPFDEPPRSTDPALDQGSQAAVSSALPATRDLVDLLCGASVDLRLSTAGLLSARFPFVNPAGRVASQCEGRTQWVVHGVDGGYLDTSGASPLVELMTALEPLIEQTNAEPENAGRCVIPFMVQIDNGFDDESPTRSPRRPAELLAPLNTVLAARIARAAEARQAAALMFTRPLPAATFGGKPVANRYAHFVNEAHPGPGAPFGWAQSRYSQKELVDQLLRRRNVQALREVRGWFDAVARGELTCST